MYKVGIDVGGTNTDAVVLNEKFELVTSTKVPTSEDIETGIREALKQVFEKAGIEREKVSHAMLGTTQCTNAIVERKKTSTSGCYSTWLSSNGLCFTLYGLAKRSD
ncbi:hydantoinase/oxoprolinase family protein [Listeria aquatica FSL S10-1188]|uniref:Hydantoinase/oxoprolinase family protein n=1 Tax=Listeria aquatica FSL S10-1188 TaxID=1265818 RepID=W7AU64_9LIST|nr:hydantoinase/oxoprolinase family protein [Listeria aquatica FSL S10-1188]